MNALIPIIQNYEPNIECAIENASYVVEEYNSVNSQRSFDSDIKYLKKWCLLKGAPDLEYFKKEYLIYFIMDHVEKHKISTIKRRVASLSRFLGLRKTESFCYDKDIMILIRKLKEKYGSSKAWGKAITLDILNDLLETCKNDGLIGIRDAAILFFGFSTGGRRRSEISTAVIERLQHNRDGTFTYNLGKSKTNQLGLDDFKPLGGRGAIALSRWLKSTNISEGYIFRSITKSGITGNELSGVDINRIVKKRCEMAGYDPKEYTAHSLRSGFVTESGKRGKQLSDVMAMTGHKTISEVMRYYQAGDIMNNSAAYLAG